MDVRSLLVRSLAHYWRTNVAVALGVATAVAALAGALLVGESVKASLRRLAVARLGMADLAVTSPRFFRESLAEELGRTAPFAEGLGAACPVIELPGTVTDATSGRVARALVYGVDERFWRFHGGPGSALAGREAVLGESLAAELGAARDASVFVRVALPPDVPAASLFGSRDDTGRTLRLTVARTLGSGELGEFSIRPRQQEVKAVFVPLELLQRTIGRAGEVNTVLVQARTDDRSAAARLEAAVRSAADLPDVGLRLRTLPVPGALSLESESALVGDGVAEAATRAAEKQGMFVAPVLTYLANAIRARGREVPYSLVSGLGPDEYARLAGAAGSPDSIVVNDWAADDLGAGPGDAVQLEYYVWLEHGRLETRSADFRLAAVVPLAGPAADPDLTPQYPGISESLRVADWEPPFPVDLDRVRPKDEQYWDRHRATPKAFLPLARAQELWGHRLGRLTSVRMQPPPGTDLEAARRNVHAELRAVLDPLALGLSIEPARQRALAAAEGATDLGEYFLYFGSFVIAAALLLAGLFFRLGIEQRLREIGLLRAVGFTAGRLRGQFLREGLAVAAIGSVLGGAAAVGYAALMLAGLRGAWFDAVGTRRLSLSIPAGPLAIGMIAGLVVAAAVIALSLRGLDHVAPRALLAGSGFSDLGAARQRRWTGRLGYVAGAAGAGLIAWSATHGGDDPGLFFGGGFLLLAGALATLRRWLERGPGPPPAAAGRLPRLAWLGGRSTAHRPGRSLVCTALVAAATFVIVATAAFRRPAEDPKDRRSGGGGFVVVAESTLPLHHDPGAPEGREALGLFGPAAAALEGARFTRLRLRPGDDLSCLNLYRAQAPRILGVGPDLVAEGRFTFAESLAATPEERANPWRLLERPAEGGAVPVVADASTLTYVLRRDVGDDLVIERPGADPIRLRVVGALRNSLFQGELLMAERHFLALFPEQEGYRVLLLEGEPDRADAMAAALESRLADHGVDAVPVARRLASFRRVEDTWLGTFQSLGALGLLLGTVGLAAVLLRNALERRRELALLRAVGYRARDVAIVVLAENAALLLAGLAIGAGCAFLAVAPTVLARGGSFPAGALAGLLLVVLAVGLAASRAAAAAVNRAPLLASLRSE